MNRNTSVQKQTNRFSESISKRNYSANILGKSLDRRFKFKPFQEYPRIINPVDYGSNNTKEIANNKMNIILENEKGSIPKHNNLEKFLFLNQQLKENDLRKKTSNIRKITSAEPNILKTKLSQKIGKILNANVPSNLNNTHKYNYSNNYSNQFVFNNNTPNIKNYNNSLAPYSLNKQTLSNIKNINFLQNNSPVNNFMPPIFSGKKKVSKSSKPYKEYYVKLIQNARETMEDFHLIAEQFNGKESEALFGVFDGHGGIEVAQKLKDELGVRFSKLLSQNQIRDTVFIENCFKHLFKKMDEDIIKQFDIATEYESTNFKSLGSTCTLVYLTKDKDTSFLYSANIGDSKGILLSKSGYSRITYEHKPTDDFENKRIKDGGGAIFNKRVFGQFGLTRAFGNIPLKKWVISEPFVKKLTITDNDRFVVIASDGIWDVITDEECFEISIKHFDPKSFCEELVNCAVSRWSKDNISCIVIKLGS